MNLHAINSVYVAWTEVYAAVFEVCRHEGHDCVGVIRGHCRFDAHFAHELIGHHCWARVEYVVDNQSQVLQVGVSWEQSWYDQVLTEDVAGLVGSLYKLSAYIACVTNAHVVHTWKTNRNI